MSTILPVADQSSSADDASYTRPEYDLALPKWTRVRAAAEGQDSIKAIPNILPKLNENDCSPENKIRNQQYLERAVYFNATGRTLEGLIGLAFSRDPDIDVGDLKYLFDDANGQGVSIYHAAQKSLSGVLQTARHGLLTDYTNGRPSISGYPAESIINWRTVRKDGKSHLSLLVLREVDEVDLGSFKLEYIERYRVYRLINGEVNLQLFKRRLNGTIEDEGNVELALPSSIRSKLTEIPFAFIGSEDNSTAIQRPPLRGLAEMNIAHFRDSADYQDSVFWCGQAQPWISGLDESWRDSILEKGLYVGSRSPIPLPVGGAMGYAQPNPNTLAKEAMDGKEELMVALGARVIERVGMTSKTATQAAGDIATGTSVLGLCCANVSEAMTRAIAWCGLFHKAKILSSAKFRLTQDFTELTMDAGKVDSLVRAWQAGAFGGTDLRNYLRRMNVIAPERTDAEITTEVEAEVSVHTAQEIDVIDATPVPTPAPAPQKKPGVK